MSMAVHFIDVGCGNMTMIIMPNGQALMYDCNITDDNQYQVLQYVQNIIGRRGTIDVFLCSHREADHMRGIEKLHSAHTIQEIWDTGVAGTTTTSSEYRTYMNLRNRISSRTIEARKYWDYGAAKLRCMNSAWPDYNDPNDESMVMKIEYGGSGVMLAGDTSCRPWKDKIQPKYSDSDLKSSILLASHHGSLTFFDDLSDQYYYTTHLQKIKPEMTLISVGPNVHDLPNSKAVEFYEKYSTGSRQRNKVFTTEDKGSMRLTIDENGSWSLGINQ